MNNCNKELISCCEPIFVFEDASNYYNKSQTNEKIEEAVSGKTDTNDVIEIIRDSIRVEDGVLYIL